MSIVFIGYWRNEAIDSSLAGRDLRARQAKKHVSPMYVFKLSQNWDNVASDDKCEWCRLIGHHKG